MIKIVLSAIIGLTILSSCNKEEEIEEGCECGTIISDRISSSGGYTYYYSTFRRDCDNTTQELQVTQQSYLNYHVGDYTCFENQ